MPEQRNIRYCEIKIQTVFILISIQAVEWFISARVQNVISISTPPPPVIVFCSISQETLKVLQLSVWWSLKDESRYF